MQLIYSIALHEVARQTMLHSKGGWCGVCVCVCVCGAGFFALLSAAAPGLHCPQDNGQARDMKRSLRVHSPFCAHARQSTCVSTHLTSVVVAVAVGN